MLYSFEFWNLAIFFGLLGLGGLLIGLLLSGRQDGMPTVVDDGSPSPSPAGRPESQRAQQR